MGPLGHRTGEKPDQLGSGSAAAAEKIPPKKFSRRVQSVEKAKMRHTPRPFSLGLVGVCLILRVSYSQRCATLGYAILPFCGKHPRPSAVALAGV